MAFHFPSVNIPSHIDQKDWFNWKWQIRHCLKTKEEYEQYFSLTDREKQGFHQIPFSVQTTPYYAQLASSLPQNPLKATIVPDHQELQTGRQSMQDPLGEHQHSPVQHIIHRYPDRVIFLVTDMCPIYCRYCTRKRFTAQNKKIIPTNEYKKAIHYIQSNHGIREVILSGGDPLTITDPLLEKIIQELRNIQHVEIIRIGSRMPAACPMRFSDSFVQMLKQHQPIFLMSHFNHPAEITEEVATALNKLADNGIPVFNQMVVLNSINNHPAIVQALCRRLLFLRVRPYYMFQCDPSMGTDHLRTSIENSRWIQKELWGVLSGLAIPRLSVDLPGGGGKVELVPHTQLPTDTNNEVSTFKGWDGHVNSYIDPDKKNIRYPSDVSLYLKEWNILLQQNYGGDSTKRKKTLH